MPLRHLMSCALLTLVAACGGGSGGGAPPAPPPVAQTPQPTTQALIAAARLGSQATFGLPYSAVDAAARQGARTWLDDQLGRGATLHVPIVDALVRRRNAGEFAGVEQNIELLASFRRYAWWHATVTAPDQVRQRIAFALSEIFVVGDTVDAFIVDPYALSGYYDTLLLNAFGNFRDLLRAIVLHPVMGVYLSHVNNRKADPVANTFPDENFAREVMQLFTIGLFELNADGTLRLDGAGHPIPTYGNDEIREFAKVFTGLSYGGANPFFGNPTANFRTPMRMFEAAHEPGEKHLLNGFVVPAGQTGMEDVDDAIDNLFEHPNVGPFIGRQLIQRLVTSNPSPAYVERVARAFDGGASGVRGDMKAVLRAVLLDDEARRVPTGATFGKLREPVVRYASLMRQLGAQSADGLLFNGGYVVQALTRQHPLSSPSVFNFFLPTHSPAGALAGAGLVAPEFQITTSTTVVGITNLVDYAITGDYVVDVQAPFSRATLDYSDWVTLAPNVDALLDRLDIVFTHGNLSAATRAAIRGILVDVADPLFRVKTALYLILVSPDYAIES
jgi:uncharacterized protein (DUF1800 family)